MALPLASGPSWARDPSFWAAWGIYTSSIPARAWVVHTWTCLLSQEVQPSRHPPASQGLGPVHGHSQLQGRLDVGICIRARGQPKLSWGSFDKEGFSGSQDPWGWAGGATPAGQEGAVLPGAGRVRSERSLSGRPGRSLCPEDWPSCLTGCLSVSAEAPAPAGPHPSCSGVGCCGWHPVGCHCALSTWPPPPEAPPHLDP